MRERREIERESSKDYLNSSERETEKMARLQLEVSLDIRDLQIELLRRTEGGS